MHLLDGGAERGDRGTSGVPGVDELGREWIAAAHAATCSPRDRGEARQVLVQRRGRVLDVSRRRGQCAQHEQRLVDDPLLAYAIGRAPGVVDRAELAI